MDYMAAKKQSRIFSAPNSSVLIFLTVTYVIHQVKPNELSDYSTGLKEPEYCPTEFFHDLKSDNEAHKTAFRIGDSLTVHCHPNDEHARLMLGDNFEVYPRGARECLPGGVWSGPRPICAMKMGLSFKHNEELLNVTVSVDEEDRITNVSDEAQNFQDEDCERWHRQHRVEAGFQEYAVVKLSTYTKHLLVHYSVIRNHSSSTREQTHQSEVGCGPAKFRFYRILEAKYRFTDHGKAHQGPTDPPIIPKARVTYSSYDKTAIRFECEKGYILTNPSTDELFTEEVRFDGQSWNPNPFPVCKAVVAEYEKLTNNSASGRLVNGQERTFLKGTEKDGDETKIVDPETGSEDLKRQLTTLQDLRRAHKNQQVAMYILVATLGAVISFVLAVTLYVTLYVYRRKLHSKRTYLYDLNRKSEREPFLRKFCDNCLR